MSAFGPWTKDPFAPSDIELRDQARDQGGHQDAETTRRIPFSSEDEAQNPRPEQQINSGPPSISAVQGAITAVPFFDDTPRPLNAQDVCAFIVNKMIGTGIFTAPPGVLLLTKSKGEALGLWVLGFIYTLIRCVKSPQKKGLLQD